MFSILSIDGGGVRGLIPSGFVYVGSMWEHLLKWGQQQPKTAASTVGDSRAFLQLLAAVAARG